MADQPDPEPHPTVRLIVIETPVPGVLLGHLLLPEPADTEVGWTTDDDEWE